jgi:hypothetical protein
MANEVAGFAILATALLIREPPLLEAEAAYRDALPGGLLPKHRTPRELVAHILLDAVSRANALPDDFGRLRRNKHLGFDELGALTFRLGQDRFWAEAIREFPTAATGVPEKDAQLFWESAITALTRAANQRGFFSDQEWATATRALRPVSQRDLLSLTPERRAARVQSALAALVERPDPVVLPSARPSAGPSPVHEVKAVGKLRALDAGDPIRVAVEDLGPRAFPLPNGVSTQYDHLIVPGGPSGPVIKGTCHT